MIRGRFSPFLPPYMFLFFSNEREKSLISFREFCPFSPPGAGARQYQLSRIFSTRQEYMPPQKNSGWATTQDPSSHRLRRQITKGRKVQRARFLPVAPSVPLLFVGWGDFSKHLSGYSRRLIAGQETPGARGIPGVRSVCMANPGRCWPGRVPMESLKGLIAWSAWDGHSGDRSACPGYYPGSHRRKP